MIYNRLRELRKKDLKISSTEKLAELLGGEDSGWYHQRIQRIETGKTKLDDKTAHEIAEKLNVPVSRLFDEEKQFNEKQRAYLKIIQKLDEKEELLLDKMFETFFSDRNGDKE